MSNISRRVTSLAMPGFGWLLAQYIRLVYATSKKARDPQDIAARCRELHPGLLAMWHGQFLMLPEINEARLPVSCMVAKHADAELIGQSLLNFDMGLIRGAGAGTRNRDRGGKEALRAAVDALRGGTTVAMTADIPPGPARKCGLGIVMIARISGVPVLPAAIATSRFRTLNTWSRFTVNLPFSRLGIVLGEPVHVPRTANDDEMETARQAVEDSLNAATRRAYELSGADWRLADPNIPLAPGKPGLTLNTYRCLTWAARPATPAILGMRQRQGKEDANRRMERYGIAGAGRPDGPLAWFHAASIGETNAILPLVAALDRARPDLNVLLTTGTVTSARLAESRLPARAVHQYIPLDSAPYVRRFLDHWRPDLAVFTESEIWPNLILETHARDVPMVLVNGRMSKTSFRRWRGRRGLSQPLFSRFDMVLAQDARFAKRFAAIGAREIVTTGNLKFDAPAPPYDETERARLADIIDGRRVLLAASTHPGEDDIVIAADAALRRTHPDLLTMIVPRHPGRGGEIVQRLHASGSAAAQRSAHAPLTPQTHLYIADTIGELGLFYSLAPASFIGGSLVPHGGQNPVEAVLRGSVPLVGPHRENFDQAYDALIAAEACKPITDAATLADAAMSVLADPASSAAMIARGRTAIADLGGALDKTLAAIETLLPARTELKRAS